MCAALLFSENYDKINNVYFSIKRTIALDVKVNDIIVMKKPHPCGCNEFLVTRIGMDFKIKCRRCSHEVMVARKKVEKNIKQIKREE